jgi:hypothetical protein
MELFSFDGASPDPQSVVCKVWDVYLDRESKKTQLYVDAHVKVVRAQSASRFALRELKLILQCKGVKERFFNLERRFACYRKYLNETFAELDDAMEDQTLRDEVKWFRQQTGGRVVRRLVHMLHTHNLLCFVRGIAAYGRADP